MANWLRIVVFTVPVCDTGLYVVVYRNYSVITLIYGRVFSNQNYLFNFSIDKLREGVQSDDTTFKKKQMDEGPKASYGYVISCST